MYAQKFTISGNIRDSSNGENLIGAMMYIKNTSLGTVSNAYGFYSISLPPGDYTLTCSYIGYFSKNMTIHLAANEQLNVSLDPMPNELQEVVVSSERRNANVSQPEMSVKKLSAKEIKRIPVLMGEVDVIKAIQLLPGVQATAEGTSGFSVRGGGYDQNLILMDEAIVYNASHLMGFFSVFNNDAVKDVTLYKGDIPASFGGRLSSLLDIRSKDGNNQRFSATGGIGTISSRLTLEGPVGSEDLTFLLSGRRTYADMFLLMSNDDDLRGASLYFYDLNFKLNYRINNTNRLFFATYLGRDNTSNEYFGMNFGNRTFTMRWNHIFTPKLFSNFSLISSFYDYYLGNELSEQLSTNWISKMQDHGLKADFTYHLNPSNRLQFGYNATFHNFVPGEGGGTGTASYLSSIKKPHEYAFEHALYASNEMSLTDQLVLKYGLRYTLFQNIANGQPVSFLEDYRVSHSASYSKGNIYNSQWQLEPRLGMMYRFNDVHSVKMSYSRTAQYIQLASNSTAGSPLDVWFQASQNVKPQLCDQIALGYFRNFQQDMYEASAEVYYKNMKDVVDFKDHARLLSPESSIDGELRFGKGKAYGLELMLRKNTGRLNGWVSYTYSRATRQVDEINDGAWYRSPFDKPHNVSIVVNYDLSPKWSVSGSWVYASGTPVTYPTGRLLLENNYIPIYSGRNEYRYPDFHRLDLSATMKLSKPGKRLQSELNFSLYNAYGRKNPWTILFRQEDNHPDVSYAEMVYLFTFVPSITYNITF
ncbi:MAG: TonB-dependent receptor [Dysgonamonadaceae bacterium]|nr:TonB-dependent receptor [Dysgonamonadaceae bacterium]